MIFLILTGCFTGLPEWARPVTGTGFTKPEIAWNTYFVTDSLGSHKKQYRPGIPQYCSTIPQYRPSILLFIVLCSLQNNETGKGKAVKIRCCPATVNPDPGDTPGWASWSIKPLSWFKMGREGGQGRESQETYLVSGLSRSPSRDGVTGIHSWRLVFLASLPG